MTEAYTSSLNRDTSSLNWDTSSLYWRPFQDAILMLISSVVIQAPWPSTIRLPVLLSVFVLCCYHCNHLPQWLPTLLSVSLCIFLLFGTASGNAEEVSCEYKWVKPPRWAVFLLPVPRLFLCYSSSCLCICGFMCSVCGVLICSPSLLPWCIGGAGIVAFPGYLLLYFTPFKDNLCLTFLLYGRVLCVSNGGFLLFWLSVCS